METALRITIEEMLDAKTIAEIGADHEDINLCVVRICSHVQKQEDEIVKANGLLDMAMKREAELRAALTQIANAHGNDETTARYCKGLAREALKL